MVLVEQINALLGNNAIEKKKTDISKVLKNCSEKTDLEILKEFKTSLKGYSEHEAHLLLKTHGLNSIAKEKKISFFSRCIEAFTDPLILLLLFIALISFVTNDMKSVAVIGVMILLSTLLKMWQEIKADNAAEKLEQMVKVKATVIRNGKKEEIFVEKIVPGDIVFLSSGDMIPADLRILESKDLFVNQITLTGEALPVEKHARHMAKKTEDVLELQNLCFMGTNVESGTATAIALNTGSSTYFGSIAESLVGKKKETSFDSGVKNLTFLMMKLIFILAPLVLFINGFTKGDWLQAFLFAISVVVGLTPEMLPMIVTANLAKGAVSMSKKKVIVKKLNAIQNFGAIDILCTDKTGTLTQGKIILEKHIKINGEEEYEKVLDYAYLNSINQTGLKNVLDEAVLEHGMKQHHLNIHGYKKIDEIAFDFKRRRISVILEDKNGKQIMITKGAVEELLDISSHAELDEKIIKMSEKVRKTAKEITGKLNLEGFRAVAVSYKEIKDKKERYSANDEKDLVLLGYIAFLDPPKESAHKAIHMLKEYGVAVKVLTGDNELVSKKICRDVGLENDSILLGPEIEKMNDEELYARAERTVIFAKLNPMHKERIILALRKKGHVVGYLGDGINDAPAMRSADVAISVDEAVDIAKESANIILLEKNLLVLADGIIEGRKVFGNIMKYFKMTTSSSFGNMFSVVGASAFLPFLPMLPIQIIVNNLLYDFSQVAIPTDNVDKEWIAKPRKWAVDKIEKFTLFIGPVSSLFDYLTFGVMLFIFNAWSYPALFQTGWFIESLFTQILIIYVIRTEKIPFLESKPSLALSLSTLLILLIGCYLPFSPIADSLGFVELPLLYWPILLVIIISYMALTQVAKNWFIKKYGTV